MDFEEKKKNNQVFVGMTAFWNINNIIILLSTAGLLDNKSKWKIHLKI